MIKRILFQIVLFLTLGSALIACKAEGKIKDDSYVVILSLDAFRWDYSDIVNTPT
ncbi:MAG TPA: alkaline phosphatase family protein, partial [Bacteroidales bacterium]|nr:alkaline phosphatase family protein [Bacteroidales bacterium]